jgi:PAS domain S-box-containing protein
MVGKGNYEYALPFYGVRRPLLIDLILRTDETVEKDYLSIQREGDVLFGEAYVFLKGKPRIVVGKARPLYDSRGNIVGATEAICDITERKRMEDSLLDSDRKYQELLEDIHEVIYIIDHSGRILFMSPVVETVFGYHPSELVGRPFTDFVFHEDLASILENLQLMAEGSISPSEFRLYKKSGEISWVRTTSRLKSVKGRVTMQGILSDITNLKNAEELYKTLADNSQAGVYIVQDGRIQYVNPHIPEYSGYAQTELIGMDVLNIVHPEDREHVRKNAIDMLKGMQSAPYEFRMIDSRGQVRRLMGTVTPITYNGKPAILGNTMDITEKKATDG